MARTLRTQTAAIRRLNGGPLASVVATLIAEQAWPRSTGEAREGQNQRAEDDPVARERSEPPATHPGHEPGH